MGISTNLWQKDRMIVLTNACNLSCGGCNQFCGKFKGKIWHITPPKFRRYLRLIFHEKKIFLFGGEPTLNPHLKEILEICDKEFPKSNFVLQTNGRKEIAAPRNVEIWKDYKDKNSHFVYLQTGFAPIDILPYVKKTRYVKLAFNNCILLKKAECCPVIYKDRAYLCQVAGPMDHLFYGGKYGWRIGKKDPFKKDDEAYIRQAMHFCYRCGWAMGKWPGPPQFTNEPYLVTPTNSSIIKSKVVDCQTIKHYNMRRKGGPNG